MGRIGCIRLRAWIGDFSSVHKTRARWIKIKPDDVAHLFHQLRVGREFEAFAAMPAQAKGAPNATYRRPADTRPLGHLTGAPMGRALGGSLKRTRHHFFYSVIGDLTRRPRSRF